MISNFFNPISTAIIVLGTVLIISTKKSLNKLICEMSVNIKTKYFSGKRNKQGSNLSPKNNNEIKKLFKEKNIKDINELKNILENFENLTKKEQKENQEKLNNLFNLWKHYMFSYLNIFLVQNSKLALLWYFNNPKSTKEMFKLQQYLSVEIENHELEKEAIFSALITNSLIAKDENDLYNITNIGIDFLIYIGFVKQNLWLNTPNQH